MRTTSPAPSTTADDTDVHRHVDSIGIKLGDRWGGVPLEASAFGQYRQTLLDEWREVDGWTPTDSRRLDVTLGKIRSDLTKRGVKYAAFFIDGVSPSGETPTNENTESVMASLTFSVHDKQDFETTADLTPELLFTAFSRHSAGGNEAHGFRISDLEPPRLTQLAVGRAAHLRRLYEPALMLDTTPPFFSETYIFSMGANHEACGVLQFSTPNMPEAQLLSRMFNITANTVTLFAEGDDTVFADERDGAVTSDTNRTPNV